MGFLAQMKVITSKEVKLHGCIGELTSLKNKASFVSDTEIGIGGTNVWYLGGIDKNKSVAVYFDVCNSGNVV